MKITSGALLLTAAILNASASALAGQAQVTNLYFGVNANCGQHVVSMGTEVEMLVQSSPSIASDQIAVSDSNEKFSYEVDMSGVVTLVKPENFIFTKPVRIELGRLNLAQACADSSGSSGTGYLRAALIAKPGIQMSENVAFTGACTVRTGVMNVSGGFQKSFQRSLTVIDSATNAQIVLVTSDQAAFLVQGACEAAKL